MVATEAAAAKRKHATGALIALWTGKKPTLRTYEMICFYFTGLAAEDELMAHEKLKKQN